MRHAGEIQAADQMVDTKSVCKTPDLGYAFVRVSYDKAILTERLELVDRRAILGADQGVVPSAAIFVAIVHHQVLLGQFPRMLAGVRDYDLTGEWVGIVSRV